MSYGGNFHSGSSRGGADEWNEPFHDPQSQQSQSQQMANNDNNNSPFGGAPVRSPYGSDPFGANDDFSGSDGGFGYDTAVVVPSMVPVASMNNSNSNNSNIRFGRPSTSDMNSDSDFGHHTTRQRQQQQQQQHQRQRSNSPNNTSNFGGNGVGIGVGAPSLGRQYSSDQFRGGDDPFGASSHSGNNQQQQHIEPTNRAGRATSDMLGRGNGSSSLSRSSTDIFGGRGSSNSNQGSSMNELNRFLEPSDMGGAPAAAGAAVGVSPSVGDPYPSLRTASTPGAYASGEQSSSASHAAPPPPAARRSNSASRLLPPKKEATPIMPPSLAVEPTLPRPKVSRRFLPYTKMPRQPDLAVAKKTKNGRYKAGDDDKHVLKCPNCQSFLKIPKLAVLMQCPTCSTVSPATTSVASVR